MKDEQSEKKSFPAAGVICTLLGGICWGFSGACGQRLFLDNALSPQTLASLRMSFSGILFLAIGIAMPGTRPYIFAPFKSIRSLLSVFVFGILGIALCQITYFETISRSNAGTATVIQYLSPVLIVAGTAIASRKLPGRYKTSAVLLAVCGVWILATHGRFDSLALSPSVLAWGVLSAIAYALSSVLPVRLFKQFGIIVTMAWGMILASVPALLIFRPWNHLASFQAHDIVFLVLIVVVGSILAYIFYMTGVNILGPENANIFACIEPVAATFFSVAWLGTRLCLTDYIGMAAIVGAIVVLSFDRRR